MYSIYEGHSSNIILKRLNALIRHEAGRRKDNRNKMLFNTLTLMFSFNYNLHNSIDSTARSFVCVVPYCLSGLAFIILCITEAPLLLPLHQFFKTNTTTLTVSIVREECRPLVLWALGKLFFSFRVLDRLPSAKTRKNTFIQNTTSRNLVIKCQA